MHMKWDKKDWVTLFYVVASALLYSFAMQVFVTSGQIFPGGFAGLSVLTSRVLRKYFAINIPFNVFYVSLNVIVTILVYKFVGKRFAIFSVIQYVLVTIFTGIIPEYQLTYVPLLIAVFGGIVSGYGVVLALNHGASGGGTDFLAMYYSIKTKRSAWNYVFFFNAGMLIVAGLLFGWNAALYSIIYQYCHTTIINAHHNRFRLSTLMIVTEHPDVVIDEVLKKIRHGITVLNGKGAYRGQDQYVLVMTVNSYQVDEITQIAQEADPKIFISISNTERIVGNYYQTPLD